MVNLIRPALPSFVFIAEHDFEHAKHLSERRIVHEFRPFLFNRKLMSVSATDLLPLREEDEACASNDNAPLLPVGSKIVVVAGLFVDYHGVVVGHARDYLCVCLENIHFELKMTPFLVRPVPL